MALVLVWSRAQPGDMARIFITGSTEGLGRAAAEALLGEGHDVVVHARDDERLRAVEDLVRRGAGHVTGDLADPDQTRDVAEQVNRLGRMDAVIHNAGVYRGPDVLPVNVVAPYLLTALIWRPSRLVYLSSEEHLTGRPVLRGQDWSGRESEGSYPDSKLFVTTLAVAMARVWPEVLSNAVDPGWVPTRMGGPSAPDDLRLGHRTQVWLATSSSGEAMTSGGYWRHEAREEPAPAVLDHEFQAELLVALSDYTGEPLAPRPLAPVD